MRMVVYINIFYGLFKKYILLTTWTLQAFGSSLSQAQLLGIDSWNWFAIAFFQDVFFHSTSLIPSILNYFPEISYWFCLLSFEFNRVAQVYLLKQQFKKLIYTWNRSVLECIGFIGIVPVSADVFCMLACFLTETNVCHGWFGVCNECFNKKSGMQG